MLANQGSACDTVQFLPAASRSSGATNGSWIDVSKYEGELVFNVNVGAVTGSIIVKVQDADDTSGTSSADVTGATTASISSANGSTKIVVPANSVRKAARVVATVTTGPVLCSVDMLAHPKYV